MFNTLNNSLFGYSRDDNETSFLGICHALSLMRRVWNLNKRV